MSNIKDHDAHENFTMQRFKTGFMKHSHLICGGCGGNNFKVTISNLAQSRSLLLDCHDCQHRTIINVKGWDNRGDKRDLWQALKYSPKKDVLI